MCCAALVTSSLSRSVHQTPPQTRSRQDRQRRWSHVGCSRSCEETPCSRFSAPLSSEAGASSPDPPYKHILSLKHVRIHDVKICLNKIKSKYRNCGQKYQHVLWLAAWKNTFSSSFCAVFFFCLNNRLLLYCRVFYDHCPLQCFFS